MGRFDGEDEEGRDTRGPGWLHDEAGRLYRLEKGTRVYRNAHERDSATDESYRLSPMAGLVLGASGSMLERISAAAPELADLFWREAATMLGQSTEDKLQRWQVQHFGRVLEPAAHGMLVFEVRHLETGKDRGTGSQFSSMAEQHRFEKHAAETSHITGWLERVEEICRRAKAPTGGAKSMPEIRLPYVETDA